MSRDTETLAVPAPETAAAPVLFLRGLRRASNWAQLIRFAAVGASGYAVNLVVFKLALDAKLDYRAAATAAFCVALVNNFVWNRAWTFRDSPGRLHGQAFRFLVVSVGAFLVSLGVLSALVTDLHTPTLLAQAMAILAVTPLSYLANKLWSFRTSPR